MDAFRGANAAIGCPSTYDKDNFEVNLVSECKWRCNAPDERKLTEDVWPMFAPDAEGVRATLWVNDVAYAGIIPRASDTGAAGWYALETRASDQFQDGSALPGSSFKLSAQISWPERDGRRELLLCDGEQHIPDTPGCFFAILMPNQRAHAAVQVAIVEGVRRITQVCLSVNLDSGTWS